MSELKACCEAYRHEAGRLIDFVRDLRHGIEQEGLDFGLARDALEDLDQSLHRFRRADCDPRFRIAFAGSYGVGKSQLINALIGQIILPEEMRDTTFLPTIVRHSGAGNRGAVVRYLTEAEVDGVLCEYGRRVGKSGWPDAISTVERVRENDIGDLVQQLEREDEQRDVRALMLALRNPDLRPFVRDGDQPHERAIAWDERRDFIVRRSDLIERYLASAVIIDLPEFSLGPDVELIDLPGTDADDPWAKQITHRYVKEVDALLIVSEADQVAGDAGRQLVDAIRGWGGHHAERLFIVINKADRYADKPSHDILGAISQLQERLSQWLPNQHVQILFTSAVAALPDAKDHALVLASVQRIPSTGEKNWDDLLGHVKERGGVKYVMHCLDEFLRSRATTVRLSSLQNRWDKMYHSIEQKIASPAREARSALADSQNRRTTRGLEQLRRLRDKVSAAVSQLKQTASAVGKPAAFAELEPRLIQFAAEVCSVGTPNADFDRDAMDVARERWPLLNRRFRDGLFERVEGHLLTNFLAQCQRSLDEPLRQLATVQSIPSASPPPSPALPILASVRLRLAERLGDPTYDPALCPYPARGLREPFGEFSDVFQRSMKTFFDARTRDIVRDLRGFLGFYLLRQLDGFQDEMSQFCDAVSKHAAGLEALCGNEESQREDERLRRLVELGDVFHAIPANPSRSLAAGRSR